MLLVIALTTGAVVYEFLGICRRASDFLLPSSTDGWIASRTRFVDRTVRRIGKHCAVTQDSIAAPHAQRGPHDPRLTGQPIG
jgi:hypothetical protein